MYRVPPNNYPFYSEEERYVPVIQADGGQLSGVEGCKGDAAIFSMRHARSCAAKC